MTLAQAIDRAVQLQQAGQLDQAEAIYRQLLTDHGTVPDALNLLGVVCLQTARVDEGIALLTRAVSAIPTAPPYRNNLGAALRGAGRLNEAEAQYRIAVQLQPGLVEAHRNLAGILLEQRRTNDAIAAYGAAIASCPHAVEFYIDLGDVLITERLIDQAIVVCAQGAALHPNSPAARNNFGVALRLAGRTREAIEEFQAAIRLQPDLAPAYSNLGNALCDQARIVEALEAYRHAIAVPQAHSNFVYHLFSLPESTPQAILNEHRAWEARHAAPLAAAIRPHSNDRSPDRRLRIGYLSPDLRRHSVAYFLEPILASHDHGQFEVFCYASLPEPDEVTDRLRAASDHWRDVFALPDQALAEQIRADGIDLLIDLAGHTSRGRPLVMARMPAPVQASYLGYPGTTGLSAIGYRITDSLTDPPGASDAFHSERLIRLPICFLCYRPDSDAPPVSTSREGPITFGSFNNLAKLSADTMQLWGRALHEVPDSRLVLKYRSLGDAQTRTAVAELLEQHGIPRARVELLPHAAGVREHLGLYNRIDIALDPTPYNGTTTTCEALWMGVPVITLAGAMHHSRVGVTLLTHAGLGELVASSPDDYVRLAVKMASDVLTLRQGRASLRQRVRSSSLLDHHQFTREIESSYKSMWRHWCAKL